MFKKFFESLSLIQLTLRYTNEPGNLFVELIVKIALPIIILIYLLFELLKHLVI